MKLSEFKRNLFALPTNRFGAVTELMIKKAFNLEDSGELSFDKFDSKRKKRIEIKSSRALKAHSEHIRDDNVLSILADVGIEKRVLKYQDAYNNKFDCSIQQIKCQDFDTLYYCTYFADKICVFKMSSKDVKESPHYCDVQHRYNSGEGQFHITNKTLAYHMKHHLVKEFTYKELFDLVK